MMKKACIIILLNLVTVAVFAQKVDSAKVNLIKPKGIKTTMVNGATMMGNLNIIQNVSKSGEHTQLLNAIKAAGLTLTFESKGPITIFAPTNAAFAKLPAGKLDTLLMPEHKLELSSLVTYHAIAGKVSAKDILHNIREHKGVANYVTLAGSKLAATIDANRNIVLTDETGGQCVISQFDVEQSNGMLHVINGVFVPKARAI
ncbi:fasciclin domain-containing protein [Mucilaginibacter mali]|uniref:Fasciclin domain-containing protein n=1 Tax=Mucilaginibacter mali TaxID=2740462 RepID=A0A7D4QI88_9SPHI|nr:fasciclin domain-containing protein [Mucilaginibacter mali]QKJ28950.1 fasciclin domain-containing protein [Mucilaginibacter mali]